MVTVYHIRHYSYGYYSVQQDWSWFTTTFVSNPQKGETLEMGGQVISFLASESKITTSILLTFPWWKLSHSIGVSQHHPRVQWFTREDSQNSVWMSHRIQTHGCDLLQQKHAMQTQQRKETQGVNFGGNQAQTSKSLIPGEPHRMCLIPLAMTCDDTSAREIH